MATKPSRRMSLRLDLSHSSPLDSPPGIAALFLIRFDIKTGYLISWQRSLSTVELEGAVEYKSLPSGLHNVKEDLVYFVHDQYVGLSAFVNQPAAESERNALMLAVGVLVPLSFGRLGKCWRHAAGLKELALECAQNIDGHRPLIDYWEKYHATENEPSPALESPIGSPSSQRTCSRKEPPDSFRRNRLPSDATAVEAARASLAAFHPALSLPNFFYTFGPLLFPLYRAALLRKRILFVTEAPVQTACDYVYDLSLFSSLPQSLRIILPTQNGPLFRPRPLFNIGVHDIPYLSTLSNNDLLPKSSLNWIACTTDNVFTMKTDLYDVLITLPPPYSKNATERVYPKVEILPKSERKEKIPRYNRLKATQRDMRRFVALRDGLHLLHGDASDGYQDDQEDTASTFSSTSIIEPLSWTQLAYTSFMWWASAGERRTDLSEEEEQINQDSMLLANVETVPSMNSSSLNASVLNLEDRLHQQPQEIALIAYFRRLTALIFTTLSDAVARQDSENIGDEAAEEFGRSRTSGFQDESETEEYGQVRFRADDATYTSGINDDEQPLLRDVHLDDKLPPVLITATDMMEMGLDAWSATDRIFVEEMLQLWWGRNAHVDGTRIRCCGIPIL